MGGGNLDGRGKCLGLRKSQSQPGLMIRHGFPKSLLRVVSLLQLCLGIKLPTRISRYSRQAVIGRMSHRSGGKRSLSAGENRCCKINMTSPDSTGSSTDLRMRPTIHKRLHEAWCLSNPLPCPRRRHLAISVTSILAYTGRTHVRRSGTSESRRKSPIAATVKHLKTLARPRHVGRE